MDMNTTDGMLFQLNQLNATMDPANPDPLQMRAFRDMFIRLDAALKMGQRFPRVWITDGNQVQLKPGEVNAFIGSTAWCGHARFLNGEHCGRVSCANYVYKGNSTTR